MNNLGHIVLSIYIHHEYYPPTLHAIASLSKSAETVKVVTRNVADSNWEFSDNVEIKLSGKKMSLQSSMIQSFPAKVRSFLQYVRLLKTTIDQDKPDIVILHDPIALLAHWLIGRAKKMKYKVWYHNHDVIEPGSMKKYSVTWFAEKYQEAAFKTIDVFTLPTPERMKYFPKIRESSTYHTVHNYPSVKTSIEAYQDKPTPRKQIRFLYQGVIRPDHGLEEVIAIMNQQVEGRDIVLTILGDINPEYRESLSQLAKNAGVADKLTFMDRIAYRDLPFETRNHDIGLAIHRAENIQYTTGGYASNKIYEYASLGLPVLYYESEHYNQVLQTYAWAKPVTLKEGNLVKVTMDILSNYESMSKAARQDFLNTNNFERHFLELLDQLKT